MTPDLSFRWGLLVGAVASPLVILLGVLAWALFTNWRDRRQQPRFRLVTFVKPEPQRNDH